MISKNLSINGFDGQVFFMALSDYDGEGHFFMETGHEMAYSITLNAYADEAINGIHDYGKSYERLPAKVSQVQSLIQQSVCKVPDLVKIDVETHEPEVLRGFGKFLSEDTSFLIEVQTEKTAEELHKVFSGFNFDFWNINDAEGSFDKLQRSNQAITLITSSVVRRSLRLCRP